MNRSTATTPIRNWVANIGALRNAEFSIVNRNTTSSVGDSCGDAATGIQRAVLVAEKSIEVCSSLVPRKGMDQPVLGRAVLERDWAIAINEKLVGSMVGPPQPGRTPFAPGSPALGDRNQVSGLIPNHGVVAV